MNVSTVQNEYIFVIILGAAIATYLTRFPLMLFLGKKELPPQLKRYMNYLAPAILTALIAPMIFTKQGNLDLTLSNHYIFAALATALTAYFSRSMLLSIITGLALVAFL